MERLRLALCFSHLYHSGMTSRLPALVLVLAAASLHAQQPQSQAATDPYMARAIRVLTAQPIVDGHNDLPWRIREDKSRPMDVDAYDLRRHTAGMTDLARLKAGHVGGQFWSIYIPGEPGAPSYRPNGAVASQPGYARVQLEQIDIARRVVARYPELQWATTADSVRSAIACGKLGSMLGLEGGHAIENSLNLLRTYYALGARYMTLTHNVRLDWADAALDTARHGGLTPFGREVVREMNRLGMLVDLAHVSPGTMSDALDVSQAPVIFSHSGARALVDYPRNVPDSILRRVTVNGGIVMVPFVPSFVSAKVLAYETARGDARAAARQKFPDDTAAQSRMFAAWRAEHPQPHATITDVADVIDHVRNVAGVEHVGIGSDLDGITETVVGLEDVSKFPALFAELARRGWSDGDLRKLAGENLLRVFAQAEAVAKRLQRERPASTATIESVVG